MCWYRAEKNFVLQGGLRNADGRDMWRAFPSNLPSPKHEYNLPNRRAFVDIARWETWKGGECVIYIFNQCGLR
jgi:hypothetical protein